MTDLSDRWSIPRHRLIQKIDVSGDGSQGASGTAPIYAHYGGSSQALRQVRVSTIDEADHWMHIYSETYDT
jgi:uncharacterized protein (UPF0248 family)